MWPTQSSFKKLLEVAVEQPVIFKSKYPKIPGTYQKHLLYPEREIQKETINVLNAAWRDRTKNKYKYIFRRWEKFCSERNYNTM